MIFVHQWSRKNPFLKKIGSKKSKNLKNSLLSDPIFFFSKKKVMNAQIPPITRWSEARLKKFNNQIFFQRCSECFNLCKKHVFSMLNRIFLSKCPRLSHFSTKIWTFRFWLFLLRCQKVIEILCYLTGLTGLTGLKCLTGLTGLTGSTNTDVEPVDQVPRYSSLRQ